MVRRRAVRAAALAAAASGVMTAAGAQAQTAAPAPSGAASATSVGEIVVTALRQSQSVQNAPAAITALSGSQLEAAGISNSVDLENKTPGLAISYGGRETNVAIRGVSNNVRSLGADPSTAVQLNGVYLPQSSMVLTDFFDVERVEVLKGPQGTLYGRNATAGVINVIADAPTAGYSAEGFVGTGSFDLARWQLALNAGNDRVAGRIAFDYDRDSGYTHDVFNGTHLDTANFRALRAQIRIALTDSATLTLLYQGAEDHGTRGFFGSGSNDYSPDLYPYESGSFYGIPVSDERVSPRLVRVDSPTLNVRRPMVYSATLDWDLGPVDFKSITGGTLYDAHDAADSDATAAQLETQDSLTHLASFSQEFDFSGKRGAKLDWIAGAFFYSDTGYQGINWQFFNLNCALIGASSSPCTFVNLIDHNRSVSTAGFGQAIYHFTDQWSLTLGGRYTAEHKRGYAHDNVDDVSTPAAESDSAFSPKVELEWRPGRDTLAYAEVSEGFKSGGISYLDTYPSVFRPEKNTAFETGFKTAWFDRRLIFDGSLFYYDYRDLQLKAAVYDTYHALQYVTTNASRADVAGLDLDDSWKVTDRFTVSFDGEYLYTRIGHYLAQNGFTGAEDDLVGRPLPLSPRLSLTVGVDYRAPVRSGVFEAHLDYSYRSNVIFPLTYDAVNNSQAGYGILNLTGRWTAPGGRYYVEIIGRNLANKLYLLSRADYAFSNVVEDYGPPANVEVRFGFKL